MNDYRGCGMVSLQGGGVSIPASRSAPPARLYLSICCRISSRVFTIHTFG